MSKYSSAKYSQVEDQAEFEENPAGRAAQAENRPIPPTRNFKSTSLRQPRNNQEGEIVQTELIFSNKVLSSDKIHEGRKQKILFTS